MVIHEASASIGAPPEQVWRVLAQVEQWPLWLPTVHSVEALDGLGLRVGARFRVAQPGLPTTVWQATMVDPARGFTWQASSPGTHLVAEHAMSAQPDGTTVVLLRLTFSGAMGSVIGRISRKSSRRYLAQEANALKRAVEAGVALAA